MPALGQTARPGQDDGMDAVTGGPNPVQGSWVQGRQWAFPTEAELELRVEVKEWRTGREG